MLRFFLNGRPDRARREHRSGATAHLSVHVAGLRGLLLFALAGACLVAGAACTKPAATGRTACTARVATSSAAAAAVAVVASAAG
jgi:hypothetical protein